EDCNFYETWGEYGNEPGNFIIPNDVLYHDGFVYVSDAISRIQKFDAATGDYVAHGTVTGPWMMAMLPSGSMLVATHYKKLAVFDPVALVENTAAAMTVPDSNGVVYNPSNGLVYISDKENNVVMAYTTGGTPQPANNLGYGPGSGFGQLDTPAGLAVDSSGNIYVADSGNDRIQVFSPSNQLINTIGSKGAGPGQLRSPYGIAISSTTGLVWVADHLNQRFTGYAPPP
ncbi:MAG TPA: NHL repeat-containing protein, partial [bacterium]|nr:NHL repeat-containing protein [bacterium]